MITYTLGTGDEMQGQAYWQVHIYHEFELSELRYVFSLRSDNRNCQPHDQGGESGPRETRSSVNFQYIHIYRKIENVNIVFTHNRGGYVYGCRRAQDTIRNI